MEDWLKDCESKWNIDILFACEAGSRAWGTDSVGSDQDLRFIYRHRDIRSYLSLKHPVEVIDANIPIDAHGWDIFKAFELASKSNPSLYEWAFSHIVYKDVNDFSKRLRQLIVENYSPFSVAMHYLSLVSRNLKEVKGKESLGWKQQKQLIQIVRSVLIMENIMKLESMNSSPFFQLNQPPENLWETYYATLVKAKKEGFLLEQDLLKEMTHTLEIERGRLQSSCQNLSKGTPFKEKLDQWLWEILRV